MNGLLEYALVALLIVLVTASVVLLVVGVKISKVAYGFLDILEKLVKFLKG